MSRTLAIILFVALAVPVCADRLELVNGDTITGRIISMSGDMILIETDYGTLEVSRAAVVSGSFGLTGSDPEDLLFHFSFDGSLADSAGNFVAANNGLRFTTDAAGLPQAALRSDGTGTYLSIASATELDTLSDFTIMFDVRLEDTSTTGYLISKWTQAEGETADGKFTLQTAGGNLTLYLVASDGTYYPVTARNVALSRAHLWRWPLLDLCRLHAGCQQPVHVHGSVCRRRTDPRDDRRGADRRSVCPL